MKTMKEDKVVIKCGDGSCSCNEKCVIESLMLLNGLVKVPCTEGKYKFEWVNEE